MTEKIRTPLTPIPTIPQITRSQEQDISPSTHDIYAKARDILAHHKIPDSLRGYSEEYHIIPYVIHLPSDRREKSDYVFRQMNDPFSSQSILLSPVLPDRLRIVHLARKKHSESPIPGDFISALDATDLTFSIIGKPGGLATRIEVRDLQGRIIPIVAVKYPIVKKGAPGHTPVVLSPYQEANKTPENIAKGMEYFRSMHEKAEKSFFTAPPSWFLGGGDSAIDGGDRFQIFRRLYPLLSRTLSLVENMDPSGYAQMNVLDREDLMRDQVERSYVVLGMNGERSYRRESAAQAKGWMQFIPSTWDILTKKYPQRDVIEDFHTGALDHASSLLMSYAHFDLERGVYERYPQVKKWMYGDGKKYLPYLLAAGYNSNVSDGKYIDETTKILITVRGRASQLEQILVAHPGLSPREIFTLFLQNFPHKNPDETRWYLKKVEYVMREVFHEDLPSLFYEPSLSK